MSPVRSRQAHSSPRSTRAPALFLDLTVGPWKSHLPGLYLHWTSRSPEIGAEYLIFVFPKSSTVGSSEMKCKLTHHPKAIEYAALIPRIKIETVTSQVKGRARHHLTRRVGHCDWDKQRQELGRRVNWKKRPKYNPPTKTLLLAHQAQWNFNSFFMRTAWKVALRTPWMMCIDKHSDGKAKAFWSSSLQRVVSVILN